MNKKRRGKKKQHWIVVKRKYVQKKYTKSIKAALYTFTCTSWKEFIIRQEDDGQINLIYRFDLIFRQRQRQTFRSK